MLSVVCVCVCVCVSLRASFLLSLAVIEPSRVEGALSLFVGKSSTRRQRLGGRRRRAPQERHAAAACAPPLWTQHHVLMMIKHCIAMPKKAASEGIGSSG